MINYTESGITQILPENLKNIPDVIAIGYAVSNMVRMLTKYSEFCSVYGAADILPERMLDALAIELRTQYYDRWLKKEQKQEIVKNTVLWHYRAGTVSALEEMIKAVFGTGKITEWYEYGGKPYFFRIWTDATLTERDIFCFRKIIHDVKNTRSHLERIELTREHWGNLFSAGYFRTHGRNVITEEGLHRTDAVLFSAEAARTHGRMVIKEAGTDGMF